MRDTWEGITYDTEKAEFIFRDVRNDGDNLFKVDESLYRTPSGRFFLHGEGGAGTRWAERVPGGTAPGEGIRPLEDWEAEEYIESFGTPEDYERCFPKEKEA